MCLTLKEIAKLYSHMAVPFSIPISTVREFPVFQSSPQCLVWPDILILAIILGV